LTYKYINDSIAYFTIEVIYLNTRLNSINKQALENEKIQINIRISFMIFVLFVFSYIYLFDKWTLKHSYEELIALPFLVLIINLFYRLFINRCPVCFQKSRMIVIPVLDVLASVYVMYLADDIGAYFAGILLWYIIGYSSRFGNKIGFIVYGITIFSWLILIYFSPYLRENNPLAFGWLIAYIIIPLYYFKLVAKLHRTIKQLHKEVDKASYKAGHDPLTNLPNRFLFQEVLEKYVENFSKNGQKFALFFIDLDGFKQINDVFGHDKGDQILTEVSQKIQAIDGDTARLGGDEFVSIVKYDEQDTLVKVAQTLVSNIQKKYKGEKEILLSASIGISCYPRDATSLYELKKYADKAMYSAKIKGKNSYSFYEILN